MSLTDALRSTQPFGPVSVSILFDRGTATVSVLVTQGSASLKWETPWREAMLLFAGQGAADPVGKAAVRLLRDLYTLKRKDLKRRNRVEGAAQRALKRRALAYLARAAKARERAQATRQAGKPGPGPLP